jgi:hypothetical protein
VIHAAYKHLDSKLRIAELTIGQWAGVVLGVLVALLWGSYVSPFGTFLTLVSSIYLGALPAGAAMLASVSEFDLGVLIRSAIAWRRRDGRMLPGPGASARGYVVRADHEHERANRDQQAPELDLATLWEES